MMTQIVHRSGCFFVENVYNVHGELHIFKWIIMGKSWFS